MTSSTGQVPSTALVIHPLQARTSAHAEGYMEKMKNLFMQRLFWTQSFGSQLADCQLIPSIRERILSGVFPLPEGVDQLPQPFNGTCKQLLSMVSETVHATVDHLDYNGLMPFLQVLDQLRQGKTFREIRIDSRNEETGSTCVGMSHAILKNLKENHGIEGTFAVQRKINAHPFEHGAVIVECSDGFVLFDARAVPSDRIFSIPFEQTRHYEGFSITAAKQRSAVPLMIKCEKSDDHPEVVFEYYTHVANGDDLVMKHFVMEVTFYPPHDFIPISAYDVDGLKTKYILIFPNQSKILLKNENASKENRTKEISFKSILEEGFFQRLEAFMRPVHSCHVPDFHIPLGTVYEQIVSFVSQEERLKQLFRQTNLDETF